MHYVLPIWFVIEKKKKHKTPKNIKPKKNMCWHTLITVYQVLRCSLPCNPSDCVSEACHLNKITRGPVQIKWAFTKQNCCKCLHSFESNVLSHVDVRVGISIYQSLFFHLTSTYICLTNKVNILSFTKKQKSYLSEMPSGASLRPVLSLKSMDDRIQRFLCLICWAHNTILWIKYPGL